MNPGPRIVRRDAGQPHLLPAKWPDVLRRVYAGRGIVSASEVDAPLSDLMTPGLRGVDTAAALLQRAIEDGKRILIVGDFDADGATSCAVAVRGLRALGASWVDYLVPNRFEYGYGLTPEIVAVAAARGPDVLITVDNGISSMDGVRAARDKGMQVVITDHHLPGEDLPTADAIVNPNQPGCGFPSKNLAGVGVVFYLLLALRAEMRAAGRATPNLADLLDLVAVGTVADLVPLDRNNRILVEQGLRRIRRGRCVPGIGALAAVAKRDPGEMTTADIGFGLAPRLNAAGRIQDMSIGIECLLTDDPDHATRLAASLDELNQTRRSVEARMRDEAQDHVDAAIERLGQPPFGICLHQPDWHPGVVGIVAARLKERFHRPAVVFAGNGEALKGSARSIPGLHIRDLLADVAARAPQLITRFGGHAMAAGLTLPGANLERFQALFEDAVRQSLSNDDLAQTVFTDGPLAAEEFDLATASALRLAGPWGQAFPEPAFDNEFELVAVREVGTGHLKMRLRPDASRQAVDGIAFNLAEGNRDLRSGMRVRLIYRLDVNEFRGVRNPQLVVDHIRPPAAQGSRSRTGGDESV